MKLIKTDFSGTYPVEYYDNSIEPLPLQNMAEYVTYKRALLRSKETRTKEALNNESELNDYRDFNFKDRG